MPIRVVPAGGGTIARMTTTASSAMIRQWARDNGLPVGDRGRLSPEILTAYAAQQSEGRAPAASEAEPAADNGGSGRLEGSAHLRIAAKPATGATGVARRVKARAH